MWHNIISWMWPINADLCLKPVTLFRTISWVPGETPIHWPAHSSSSLLLLNIVLSERGYQEPVRVVILQCMMLNWLPADFIPGCIWVLCELREQQELRGITGPIWCLFCTSEPALLKALIVSSLPYSWHHVDQQPAREMKNVKIHIRHIIVWIRGTISIFSVITLTWHHKLEWRVQSGPRWFRPGTRCWDDV